MSDETKNPSKADAKTSKPKSSGAGSSSRAPRSEKAAPKEVMVEKKAAGRKTTTSTTTKTERAPKSENARSFADLKPATKVPDTHVKQSHAQGERGVKKSIDGRIMQNGARKNAGARVFLKPGSGKITVNGRALEVYFARPVLRMMINQPFQIAQREGQYDVQVNVAGGGLSGQAGAVRHAIARAMCDAEPDLRKVLKAEGFLTRDARVVERKKYGRAKARRRFQFSKR